MPWIKIIDETNAQGELQQLYEELKKKYGKISTFQKALSMNIPALKAHMKQYSALMYAKEGLTGEEREIIAVTVSKQNQCKYCLETHSAILDSYWKDKSKLIAFLESKLELPERSKLICSFATKLTTSPHAINKNDIELLKTKGLTDLEILDLVLVASYFNFLNRISLSLGL